MSTNGAILRKLIVVSTEDASKISSWSNVPYLFSETLKAHGIEVIPVTLHEQRLLRWLAFAARKIVRLTTGWNSTWDYSRSRLHAWSARRQIDRVCRSHAHDAVLVLSFSHAPAAPREKPLFLFGDWPYAYAIEKQHGRQADRLEQAAIARELQLIRGAEAIFVLFPVARDYLAHACPTIQPHYLGNVINAIESPRLSDVDTKCNSSSLLFIGKPHYLKGAERLLLAYERLKSSHPTLSLDIIGMDSSMFPSLPAGVTCHGYLDKGDDADRETYYQLLRKARLFVNTNPKWASFSATLEALFFHTPIITSRVPEMVKTFGETLPFGGYLVEDEGDSLEDMISALLSDSRYREKAIVAHEATRDFSWDNYVEQMLKIANETLAKKTPQTPQSS